MAVFIDVQTVGFEALEAHFLEAPAVVQKAMQQDLQLVGEEIRADAARESPVVKGRLRSSLTVRPLPEGTSVGTDLVYAPVVMFAHQARGYRGIRHLTPNPFLIRVFEHDTVDVAEREAKIVETTLGSTLG